MFLSYDCNIERFYIAFVLTSNTTTNVHYEAGLVLM